MGLKFRNGVFIVVFKKEENNILYLLLKRKLHWTGWEFPKGGIEAEETKLDAVKRELKEETGLKTNKVINSKYSGKFLFKKKSLKGFDGMSYNVYLVEVQNGKIKIDKREHSGFKWAYYKTAMRLLTWNDQKKYLKLVNDRFNK